MASTLSEAESKRLIARVQRATATRAPSPSTISTVHTCIERPLRTGTAVADVIVPWVITTDGPPVVVSRVPVRSARRAGPDC